MKYIEFLEQPTISDSDYNNFIFFEPSSHRINENEILYQGDEVQEIFYQALDKLGKTTDLKDKILLNRLNRINMMLDLVKNTDFVIITKFIHKVWRRYIFFSNLGELFLDLETYAKVYDIKNTTNKKLFG